MKTTKKHSTLFLSFVLVISFFPVIISAQVNEKSVQLPENIEKDIQSLNNLITEFDNESVSMNRDIETLVTDFHTQLTELKDGNLNEIQKKRTAERAANLRAQIQKKQYDYLSNVNSISAEIIHLTDRLQNTDLSIEELENTNSVLINEFSEKLAKIEGRMRRGSVLALFGGLETEIEEDVDQLTLQYISVMEQGNKQIDYAVKRTEFLKNKIDDFGGSIRENTSFLGKQAEMMEITSGMLLERVKFSVENEKIVLELLQPMESLEELAVQLSGLTGDFNLMEQMVIKSLDPEHSLQNPIIDDIRFGESGMNDFDLNRSYKSGRSKMDMKKIHEENIYKGKNNK